VLIVTALAIMTTSALAQAQKQLNFTINTPYALRMGDYMLPAGSYILRQALQNDLNLFALHPKDLTREPIAMIRTVRIDYEGAHVPDHTKLFIDLDESTADATPVLQGWTIPGLDGWEVVGVVEKKSGVMTKYAGSKSMVKAHKLDRKKLTFTDYEAGDKPSKVEFKTWDH